MINLLLLPLISTRFDVSESALFVILSNCLWIAFISYLVFSNSCSLMKENSLDVKISEVFLCKQSFKDEISSDALENSFSRKDTLTLYFITSFKCKSLWFFSDFWESDKSNSRLFILCCKNSSFSLVLFNFWFKRLYSSFASEFKFDIHSYSLFCLCIVSWAADRSWFNFWITEFN